MRRARTRLPLRHAVALGLMQGPTELLPISSSGHTALIPWLAGWSSYTELDPALRKSFEVALHAGAGAALAIDMRTELIEAARNGGSVRPKHAKGTWRSARNCTRGSPSVTPGEHETVDRFRPDQITDGLSRVTIAAGYQDLVPALSRCGHQEVEEFQHDRVIRAKLGIRDRVADPVGPARAQAGGSCMGSVVQLLDRGQDPVPGSSAEPATTVDDVGNGLPRHPRSPRHVVDRGARGGTRPT